MPVGLHSRFEGALLGLLAVLYGFDRLSERDRHNLDAAADLALNLAEGLGQSQAIAQVALPVSWADLATWGAERQAIALLPALLRWFDRPAELAVLLQEQGLTLTEPLALGALAVARSLVADPNSIAAVWAKPLPTSWGDWPLSGAIGGAISPGARAEGLAPIVALQGAIAGGGRWSAAVSYGRQRSPSAALWAGLLVGALGGVAAIPAAIGAAIPSVLGDRAIAAAAALAGGWAGRRPAIGSQQARAVGIHLAISPPQQ
ncbi:MAG: hypothetical protein EA001_12685 [Oscillatoriales cyanobacterium]|nr:MAG: hypothetical protein EA001_12685 [Oscillatoriales cyanobacterium]